MKNLYKRLSDEYNTDETKFSFRIIIVLLLFTTLVFVITFCISMRNSIKLEQEEHLRSSQFECIKFYIEQNNNQEPHIVTNDKDSLETFSSAIADSNNKDSIEEKDNIKNDSLVCTNFPIAANILNEEFKMNHQNIDYATKQSSIYISLYNSLLVIIILYTTLMSISVFMISHSGWTKSKTVVKVFAGTVIIILGLANLINAVIEPKDNFNSYMVYVKQSENNQIKIIRILNDFNKKSTPKECEAKMDSIIKNLNHINSINDILPTIDEHKISTTSMDFNKLGGS